MLYFEHKPIKPLDSHIEMIWFCRSKYLNSANLTIPLINHELVINFTEGYKINSSKDLENNIELPNAWISGLQSKALFSESTGEHEMMGIVFKPTGLKTFIKNPLYEFTDSFIDPILVFGKSFSFFLESLYEAKGISDKLKIIESFFIKQMHKRKPPNYLADALRLLSESFVTKGNIAKICDEVSISNKSLIASFNNYLGITPNKYAHLQVINKAISQLAYNPSQSLTPLTYDLNFFDQPHFTKLFKNVTSLTPSQYAEFVVDNKIELDSPNFITLEG